MLSPPPPAPARRVVWAMVGLGTGILASAFIGAAVIEAAGYEIDVAAGIGTDVGRTAMQLATDQPLDDRRVPLALATVLQLPLWAAMMGAVLLARREGLEWVRDLAWSMRWFDVPVGVAIGVALQLVVVPLVYVPIFELFGDQDLSEAARALVGSADGWGDVVAAIVMVVIAAPLVEEVFFRGLLHGAVAEQLGGRGRGGVAVALVVSSLIFAMAHFQLLQLPALFVVGLVTAALLQFTRRLGPAIWAHVGFNATTVVFLVLL